MLYMVEVNNDGEHKSRWNLNLTDSNVGHPTEAEPPAEQGSTVSTPFQCAGAPLNGKDQQPAAATT